MEFAEVLKQRHSMRMFTRQPVEAEKLQRLLEMTNTAPSAYNLQSYEAFVVKDPTKKVALSAAAFDQSFARQNFISEAPLVLVFCADPSRAGGRYGSRGADLYGLQDATIAATFAHLAAVDLGLSSVWVGAFDEAKVAEILGISGLRPVTMLPVGYPGTEARATARRGLREVFHEL